MKKKGFTLIELLVVIAIIALLLAIIVPALRKAKEMAAAAVCLANDSSASKAWISYAEDFKGNIMDGDTGGNAADARPTYNGVRVWSFVAFPQNESGSWRHTDIEDEIRGMSKGALWEYMGKAAKAYNCPADKRATKQPTNNGSYSATNQIGGFRTFSMGAVLSRWPLDTAGTHGIMWNTGEKDYVATKRSDFTNPSGKFVFLEEWDPRGYNDRTFNIWLGSIPSWGDAIAMAHNGSSTFGYADGHAERYKWTGPETRKFFDAKKQEQYNPHGSPVALTDRKDIEDYMWFTQRYVPGRKK